MDPDNEKGSFTCFTPYYVIVSANLLSKIDRLQVGDISSASDHSPVYFDLTTRPGSTFCINKLLWSSFKWPQLATISMTITITYLQEEKSKYSGQEFLLCDMNVLLLPLQIYCSPNINFEN